MDFRSRSWEEVSACAASALPPVLEQIRLMRPTMPESSSPSRWYLFGPPPPPPPLPLPVPELVPPPSHPQTPSLPLPPSFGRPSSHPRPSWQRRPLMNHRPLTHPRPMSHPRPPWLPRLPSPQLLGLSTVADPTVMHTDVFPTPRTHTTVYPGLPLLPLILEVNVQTNKPVLGTMTHATHTYTVAPTKLPSPSAHTNKHALYDVKTSPPMPSYDKDVHKCESSSLNEAGPSRIRISQGKRQKCFDKSIRLECNIEDIEDKIEENNNIKRIVENFDTALLKSIMRFRHKDAFLENELRKVEAGSYDSDEVVMVLNSPRSPGCSRGTVRDQTRVRKRTVTPSGEEPCHSAAQRPRIDLPKCSHNSPRRRLSMPTRGFGSARSPKSQDEESAESDEENPQPSNPNRRRAQDFW